MAGPWCPDIWSNIILDISVKVFFEMSLTFKLVDFKQINLVVRVGHIKSVEGINGTKADSPQARKNSASR